MKGQNGMEGKEVLLMNDDAILWQFILLLSKSGRFILITGQEGGQGGEEEGWEYENRNLESIIIIIQKSRRRRRTLWLAPIYRQIAYLQNKKNTLMSNIYPNIYTRQVTLLT